MWPPKMAFKRLTKIIFVVSYNLGGEWTLGIRHANVMPELENWSMQLVLIHYDDWSKGIIKGNVYALALNMDRRMDRNVMIKCFTHSFSKYNLVYTQILIAQSNIHLFAMIIISFVCGNNTPYFCYRCQECNIHFYLRPFI